MNLSDHFTLEQLTFSETAIRKGIDNVPNPGQTANLTELAQSLERVQSLLGHPLHINSAFRSPKVNAAVGGSTTSAHMEGYAADFTCKQYGSPLEICQAIAASDIAFDQCIQEGTWVHLSINPTMRKEVLTAHFAGGRVSYTPGLTDPA